MAEVYLAKDTETERAVVLKVFPSRLIEEPRIRSRFLKIYSGIPAIRHPNLCQTYEGKVGEGNRPYVALEYVKGQSFDKLSARKQMPLKEVTATALQITGALSAAHAAGWLHLALKPSN
ncbi:MAG: serine/threonine protein kinase, partial [Blastocatellia bacterium]|nr:serine/threonine protein kinase [Blastocatellia bacterium]